MHRNVHTTVRNLVLAGVTSAALISPVVATARPASDVHGQVRVSQANIDLRSPDAALPVKIAPVQIDLRSPDAALPVTTTVTNHPESRFATHNTKVDTGSFDVGDAAIGAGGALLIALACGGSLYAIRRRSPVTLSH